MASAIVAVCRHAAENGNRQAMQSRIAFILIAMDAYLKMQIAARSTAYAQGRAPTDAQAKAGNYLKGRVTLHGLPIAIEVPPGHYRCGKDANGKEWRSLMQFAYGHFEKCRGNDGDGLDVFVGPFPESESVWVVNQRDKSGGFDEHKVMLGFMSAADAEGAYMRSYEAGWTGLDSITACSIAQLKWWMQHGDKSVPLTPKQLPFDGTPTMDSIAWNQNGVPANIDMPGLMYLLRREDAEGLMLDAVTTADVLEDADEVLALDALVVPMNKLERKMQQLQAVMVAAGDTVKPVAMQITPPFKQRGTTNVAAIMELSDGQTVTIFLHNPDTTPNKIAPNDELISWKWMLNKKDVTILVAPESGQDLNPREVGRRIMRVAEKNSAKFAQANRTRAERMASIQGMKDGIAAKEAELGRLQAEIVDLTAKVEAKRAQPSDGRLTPDTAGNLSQGAIVADGDGNRYLALGARHDWLEVAPFQNGRPVVSADTTFKFLLTPEKAGAYPERRADPVFDTGEKWDANAKPSAEAAGRVPSLDEFMPAFRKDIAKLGWKEDADGGVFTLKKKPSFVGEVRAQFDGNSPKQIGWKFVLSDESRPFGSREVQSFNLSPDVRGEMLKALAVYSGAAKPAPAADPAEVDKSEAASFAPSLEAEAEKLGLKVEQAAVSDNGAVAYHLSKGGSHIGSVITKGMNAEATDAIGMSLGTFAANGFGAEKAVAAVAAAQPSAENKFEMYRDGNGEKGKIDSAYPDRANAQSALDEIDTPAGTYYVRDLRDYDILYSFRAESVIGKASRRLNVEEFDALMRDIVRWANKEHGQYSSDWIRRNAPAYMALRHGIDADWAAKAIEQRWMQGDAGKMPEEQSATGDNDDAARAFIQSAIDGKADFYDKAVTDRLAELAGRYTDGEMADLIKQAKTAAKNFFIAEFQKKAA